VIEDAVKLTTYFGERDRADGGFLADALLNLYGREGFRTSVLLRGTEGFGAKHRLQSQRLLTLSEDLPLVSVAVDARARIEAVLPEVEALHGGSGLVTLERARMLTAPEPVEAPEGQAKLTVYCGRREPFAEVVDVLRRHGVSGATVLLGVDGTAHGVRQRAKFFGTNSAVPLMVIAVGDTRRIIEVLVDLAALLPRPLITLERLRVCKRDGEKLTEPRHLPERDPSGLAMWQKLMVYTGEQAHYDGQPLYRRLIRELRQAGAAGATCLRGVWGYHGDHLPHGDSFWQLRRRVPVVTVVVDTPERIRRWFAIVDAITTETGLVTSEMVPAFRATAAQFQSGGLRLAQGLH
jgi:PII-like signaling protein